MRQIEPEGFGAVGGALRLVIHLIDGAFLVHGHIAGSCIILWDCMWMKLDGLDVWRFWRRLEDLCSR